MEVVLMLARMIGPKEKKDSNIIPSHPRAIKSDNGEHNHVVIRLRVIGFIDDPNSILVRTELGVFMVDIESNGYQQLSRRINFATVYPYVSFYSTGEISGFGFSHHRQDVIPMPGCYFTNDDSYHTAMIGSCNSPEHAGTDDCDCQSMKFHITIALTTYPTSVWMTAT
uniref:Uncharacterized protein n=1 Tax=Oryza nivara TaxID=4536 RepID=A0A0E0IPB2_ORYNI